MCIKLLGNWIDRQIQGYKNNKGILKDDKHILKLWEEFINDNKYKKYFEDNNTIWINKLNEVKKYIDVNNKRPSENDKDKKYFDEKVKINKSTKHHNKTNNEIEELEKELFG